MNASLPPVSRIEDFMRREPEICGLRFDRTEFLDAAFSAHPVWTSSMVGTACVCAGTLAIVVDIDRVEIHHADEFYAQLSADTRWTRLAGMPDGNPQALRSHVDFALRVLASQLRDKIYNQEQELDKLRSRERLLLQILERDDPR